MFTSGYVNTKTILHFFYKITNERGTKTMFTYAHVKWFYGQSERMYYLNYFIITLNCYFYFCVGINFCFVINCMPILKCLSFVNNPYWFTFTLNCYFYFCVGINFCFVINFMLILKFLSFVNNPYWFAFTLNCNFYFFVWELISSLFHNVSL